LPLPVLVLLTAGIPLLAKQQVAVGPLCHEPFRALERCISNDYDRLNAECSKDYGMLRACLKQDWQHIDDAGGYERPAHAFNRMRGCRHGLMMYNPMDWYIGRAMEVYGEWAEKKVDIWRRVVKKGQVAVDVGAHIGSLTLPLSALVGDEGRVVAFEPFYPSFATLAANVGLNSLQNVELRQAILSDRGGRVFMNRASLAFGVHDFFNIGSMNFNGLRVYNASDDVERPSALWDEYQVMLLDQLSLARLDFIKVDAEGMELEVLTGAQRMIKKFKPVLFIEYRNPWEKETKVLDFLRKKLRYECVLLRIPVFNIDNFRGFAEDIWGGATKLVSFNLLCKHRWWEYPEMDEAVLELFDTAVDTDIEGLRTTPTADPFEAMALSGHGDSGGAFDDLVGSGGIAGSEMTLDELLADPDPAPKAASKKNAQQLRQPSPTQTSPAQPRPAKKKYEDMTLDELLDEPPTDLQPKRSAPLPPPPARPAKKRYEDMTLDELLDDSEDFAGTPKADVEASKPQQKQPPPKHGGKPKQKKYEEMTLDELLDDPSPPPAPPPARAKKPVPTEPPAKPPPRAAAKPPPRKPAKKYEEMTLDELLDDPGVDEPPARGGQRPGQRAADELSLDELLGEVGTGAGSVPRERELSLDDLLGPDDGDEGGKKNWEDMTLDELLGPDPAGGAGGDSAMLDDFLGDPPGGVKYEDMTLDELLALDDPAPAPAKPPPKAPPKKAASAAKPPPSAAKAASGVKAPSSKGKPGGAASAGGAAGGRPKVKVSYDEELTLDEL